MLYVNTLIHIFQNIHKDNTYNYLFKLRKVNKKYKNIVESLKYCRIFENSIKTNFKKIRKTFKKALYVNISHNNTISGKYFKYLKGIYSLNMRYCNQETITDKSFENLKGIHKLNMSLKCKIKIDRDVNSCRNMELLGIKTN